MEKIFGIVLLLVFVLFVGAAISCGSKHAADGPGEEMPGAFEADGEAVIFKDNGEPRFYCCSTPDCEAEYIHVANYPTSRDKPNCNFCETGVKLQTFAASVSIKEDKAGELRAQGVASYGYLPGTEREAITLRPVKVRK